MENNQKIFRYQNNDVKPKTFNSFNNLESNQNKPNVEGNWRSKGLESVNYPSNNSNFTKKNFGDYNNQSNYRNISNSNFNSFNQNTNYNR